MSKLLPFLIYVLWTYEQGYRDVLQESCSLGAVWEDVPGPYSLDEDQCSYRIAVNSDEESRIFRIRRTFGAPWL